jgi:hypothetical protein
LGIFCAAGLLPCIGFLIYFHRFEGWRAASRSVLLAWLPLLESSVSKGFYYQWCLGLDAPFYHLRLMLAHFLVVVGIVGVYGFVLKRKLPANRLLPLLLITPLLALASRFDWTDCGRSLALLTLALCVILIAKYRRLPPEAPPVFPLLWGLFALGLLAKLGLFCRIWHYGFVLAMPAFAGAIYLLLWLLPLLLEKHGVQRTLFRYGAGLVLMLGFIFLFTQSELRYGKKTVPVGQNGDRMLAFDVKTNPAGAGVQIALAWLSTNAPPDATLVVLPEGVMVNYLSRRSNPTRYCVWNPAEEEVFGQDKMTAAFIEADPDFVMLIQRDASEYGVQPFGRDSRFGLDLMRWIERAYEPVWIIGHEPFQTDGQFGIKILRKVAGPTPVSPERRGERTAK